MVRLMFSVVWLIRRRPPQGVHRESVDLGSVALLDFGCASRASTRQGHPRVSPPTLFDHSECRSETIIMTLCPPRT